MPTDSHGCQDVILHTTLMASVQAILDCPSNRLDDLVKAAKLDPKRDLCSGDWRGLDFSGNDLRGFNFTGADLRDVCFDGALTEGAIFDRATFENPPPCKADDFNACQSRPRPISASASTDQMAVELYVIAERATRIPSGADETGKAMGVAARTYAELVEAVAEDEDRVAFLTLYEHFAPRIKAFLRLRTEPASAADLAQEVMTRLWERAGQFDPQKSSVTTWLFRIARNIAIDQGRRRRVECPMSEEALLAAEPSPLADEALYASEREERVRVALSELSDEQRALVKLAFFEGLSHRRIAERTGLPLGTVKGRIRLALARLRREL
jgi:RNA polymerase sigma factor (sigma-70 family)